MRLLKTALVAGALAVLSVTTIAAYAQDTKIGFIVKQPEEPWFQDEWKFADQAAKEKGFTLVKIGAEDGE
ncbi:arabinose ABC transporter substrate-binding protein, partial [Mesorhizobium sp. M7A.F.Ca.ET.027.02.1.1]